MKKSTALMVFVAAAGLASCGGPTTPTANLKSDIDSLSYAIGVTNTQGLMDFAQARLGVDSTHVQNFINGIIDGTSNINAKEKATLAGKQIGEQVSKDMFNSINRQIFIGDTIHSLNKDHFIEGFNEGLDGKNTTSTEQAAMYVRETVSKFQKDSIKVQSTIDSLSYMLGLSNTQGLISYATSNMGVDSAYISDFKKGIKDGFKTIDTKQRSYMAGVQIGMQANGEMFESINKEVFGLNSSSSLSKENFLAGFIDGVQGKDQMKLENVIEYVSTKSNEIRAKEVENKYGKYKKENEKFLVENKTKEGIKTTESGLQYRIIKEGKGEIPSKESRVKVHYKGTLIDGTQFDSSYDRKQPSNFLCNQVIKGWTEALTMMPVGSKWELFIPQELGYGAQTNLGEIKPFSTLIFEVELLEIIK